jgi:hypothetical protein
MEKLFGGDKWAVLGAVQLLGLFCNCKKEILFVDDKRAGLGATRLLGTFIEHKKFFPLSYNYVLIYTTL